MKNGGRAAARVGSLAASRSLKEQQVKGKAEGKGRGAGANKCEEV